jgi:uncharacterized repeat protein (TIGR01451 family)
VEPLNVYQPGQIFIVNWTGQDSTSGVDGYDVQVRDGVSGAWTDWLTDTVLISETFTGQDGHTYAFRSRAWDNAGNMESWPTQPDAETAIDVNMMRSMVDDLPSYQSSFQFLVTWHSDGEAMSYDVQVRDGMDGPWTGWLTGTTAVSETFTGEDGHTYYFRSRARDSVGNVEAWPVDPDAQTTMDLSPPTSAVEPLHAYQKALIFTVTWAGQDSASGVVNYDVQVRDGESGTWIDWMIDTMMTSETFTGQDGHIYYFRSRSRDNVGHVETWPTEPDTWTTVDVNAPTSAVEPLDVYQTTLSFPVSWLGEDGTSGVASYDIWVREEVSDGLSGWSRWIGGTTGTSATFDSEDGQTYYFRSQASDSAGNVEAWLPEPDAQTTVDLSPPTSAVWPLVAYQTALSFTVSWVGQDSTSDVASYDLQVREGMEGAWTDWRRTPGTAISATFNGENGHTYYFRSRAEDSAGNIEAWPESWDAKTTVSLMGPPDLRIAKHAPRLVHPKSWITYTLTVTNVGGDDAVGLVITDTVPANSHYVRGGTYTDDEVRWELDRLAPGSHAEFRFVVTSTRDIINENYGVSAQGGYGAYGVVPVVTEVKYIVYLPLVMRNR